jgi:hypothetical protein
MMAKFSMKQGGKEVGPAEVYAEPHDMTGKAGVDLGNNGYGAGNRIKPEDVAVSVGEFRSKPYPEVKTTGIKTRGNGAATKGTMARGPMA